MRSAFLLILMLVACNAGPREAVLGGLLDKPPSAVAMQRLGPTGEPERVASTIRLNESYALPNEDVQAFLDGVHEALVGKGFRVIQNDEYSPEKRIMTYASPDGLLQTGMVIEAASFDKTLVTLTEWYPKGSEQNP